MKLLVTRPVEDAAPLAAKLETLDHEAIIIPLLAIVPRDNVELPVAPVQALCVSSANGLAGKRDFTRFLELPFFAIGPQSALEARHKGFTHVHDKGGNVEGLVRHITKSAKPGDGPILYLSGSETTGDIEGKLKAQGFTVIRTIVYDAEPCDVPGLAAQLAEVDGVLLYSPRTAKLWLKQLEKAGLLAVAQKLVHFCLSANVAASLPQNWLKRTAPTPDENGMLAALDRQDEAE